MSMSLAEIQRLKELENKVIRLEAVSAMLIVKTDRKKKTATKPPVKAADRGVRL